MPMGRLQEATEQFRRAFEFAETHFQKASVEVNEGEVAYRLGKLKDSIAYHENGLRRLSHWVPRSNVGLAYALLRETMIQAVHTLIPKRLHRRSLDSTSELATRLLTMLSHPYAFSNTVRLIFANSAAMNRAELVPPTPELLESVTLHGTAMMFIGWHRRGARYLNHAIRISEQLNDRLGLAKAFAFGGIGGYSSAKYEDGISKLDRAVQLFRSCGDMWTLHLAEFHLGCCHYMLGNIREAVEQARATYDACIRIGDTRAMCSSYLWSRATAGRIPFDQIKSTCPVVPEDIMSTSHLLISESYWHLHHRRTNALNRVYNMDKDHLLINYHTAELLPALAHALRMHADSLANSDQDASQLTRRRALRWARWVARLNRFFPCQYVYSLREYSFALQANGMSKKALKHAERSCAVAERQQAKYEYAQSSLTRAKLKHTLEFPGASAEVEQAEAALEPFEKMIEEAVANKSVTLSSDAKG